jgi:hypothetical protein
MLQIALILGGVGLAMFIFEKFLPIECRSFRRGSYLFLALAVLIYLYHMLQTRNMV